MSLEIEPAPATLGAVVRGVKLAALDPREQHLSHGEQAQFGRGSADLQSPTGFESS